MPWLKSWAEAVIQASKTDQWERLKTKERNTNTNNNSADSIIAAKTGDQLPSSRDEAVFTDHTHNTRSRLQADTNPSVSVEYHPAKATTEGSRDGTTNGARVEVEGLEGSVQALRENMKAEVREKYAFSGTAKLWAAAIDESYRGSARI